MFGTTIRHTVTIRTVGDDHRGDPGTTFLVASDNEADGVLAWHATSGRARTRRFTDGNETHQYDNAHVVAVVSGSYVDTSRASVELWQERNGDLYIVDPSRRMSGAWRISAPTPGQFSAHAAALIEGQSKLTDFTLTTEVERLTRVAVYHHADGGSITIDIRGAGADAATVGGESARQYIGTDVVAPQLRAAWAA